MPNIIIMNRGDTYTFDLTIADSTSDTGRYVLKDDDTLYFGVMDPNQMFENALIKKKYTYDDTDSEGNLTIVIKPEDTLDLYPGRYYYAIKLHKKSNTEENYIDEVITVINNTKFIILD